MYVAIDEFTLGVYNKVSHKIEEVHKMKDPIIKFIRMDNTQIVVASYNGDIQVLDPVKTPIDSKYEINSSMCVHEMHHLEDLHKTGAD